MPLLALKGLFRGLSNLGFIQRERERERERDLMVRDSGNGPQGDRKVRYGRFSDIIFLWGWIEKLKEFFFF